MTSTARFRAGRRRVGYAAILVAFVLAMPTGALGQSAPLVDGNYAIDVVDLPVLGTPRAVGLGGAYSSVGEGIGAAAWNPAAVATRSRWERDWFAWEVSLGALFPTNADSNRVFGRTSDGGVRTKSFRFFDVGLRLQFGPASVGVLVRPREFTTVNAEGDRQRTTSQTAHVDFALELMHGDLVVGGGARLVNLDVEERMSGTSSYVKVLGILGANAEVGATYRPHGEQYRVSAVVRLPIHATRVSASPSVLGTPHVPASVSLPWELSFSGAFGFGARPFNSAVPTLRRPHVRRSLAREGHTRRLACVERGLRVPDGTQATPAATSPSIDPAAAQPTPPEDWNVPVGCEEFRFLPAGATPPRPRYGFVTAELVIIGPSANAIGLDGYVTQTRRTWGSHATVSPRIGVEGEPWRNRMKLRGGMYREPDRSSVASARVHFTSGFDLRLFDWDVFGILSHPLGFQVTATSDLAPGYLSFGVGVGIWH